MGEFAGSQERPTERKSHFMANVKTFLHSIARFAAHLISKIPPMELK
jgi:hypothetical protein